MKNMEPNFNPMTDVFVKPPKGTDQRAEFITDLARGDLHTANLYDEEGDAHGGEKVNLATGKASVNKKAPTVGKAALMSVREANINGKDIMGDLQDPNNMSLEELMATQND